MPERHLTYIVTAWEPRSKDGLGNDFPEWARAAGLPRRCRLHGLKKGGMQRAVEAGNTPHELMARSGHESNILAGMTVDVISHLSPCPAVEAELTDEIL